MQEIKDTSRAFLKRTKKEKNTSHISRPKPGQTHFIRRHRALIPFIRQRHRHPINTLPA